MCIYIWYSMSIIEKVFHCEENEISVIEIDGEIWFKASLALGYVNVCKSISDHVDPEDRIALGQLKKGVTKRNPTAVSRTLRLSLRARRLLTQTTAFAHLLDGLGPRTFGPAVELESPSPPINAD